MPLGLGLVPPVIERTTVRLPSRKSISRDPHRRLNDGFDFASPPGFNSPSTGSAAGSAATSESPAVFSTPLRSPPGTHPGNTPVSSARLNLSEYSPHKQSVTPQAAAKPSPEETTGGAAMYKNYAQRTKAEGRAPSPSGGRTRTTPTDDSTQELREKIAANTVKLQDEYGNAAALDAARLEARTGPPVSGHHTPSQQDEDNDTAQFKASLKRRPICNSNQVDAAKAVYSPTDSNLPDDPAVEDTNTRIAQLEASLDALDAVTHMTSRTTPAGLSQTKLELEKTKPTTPEVLTARSRRSSGTPRQGAKTPPRSPGTPRTPRSGAAHLPLWQQKQLLQLPAHLDALKQIAALEAQLDSLSGGHAAAHGLSSARASEELTELRQQAVQATQTEQRLTDALQTAELENAKMKVQLIQAVNSRDANEAVAATDEDFEVLRNACSSREQEHGQLLLELGELIELSAAQEEQLDRMSLQVVEMEGQVVAVEQRGEDMAGMTERALAGMTQQFEDTRELMLQKNQQVQQANNELKQSTKELQLTKELLTEKDAELIEFNREWQLREKEVIGLEQQLEELQLEAMKRDGQDIQAEQAEQDIQACEEAVRLLHDAQQEIEILNQKCKTKEEETEALQLRLAEVESSHGSQSDAAQLQLQLVEFADELQQAQHELANRDAELNNKERTMQQLASRCTANDEAVSEMEAEVAVMEVSQSARDGELREQLEARDREVELLSAKCIAKEAAVSEMEAQLSVMFAWRSLFRGERRKSMDRMEHPDEDSVLHLSNDESTADPALAELQDELQRSNRKVEMRDSVLEDKNRELEEVMELCRLKEEELGKMEMKAKHAVKAAEAWSAAWHTLSEQSGAAAGSKGGSSSNSPENVRHERPLSRSRSPRDARFEEMDVNNNGVIDRQEWQTAARAHRR